MNQLIKEINDNIYNMNKIPKRIFTYSLIISVLTFIGAVFAFIFARVYWDYYYVLNLASENLLQIFQLSSAAIIVSFMVEIFLKAKSDEVK